MDGLETACQGSPEPLSPNHLGATVPGPGLRRLCPPGKASAPAGDLPYSDSSPRDASCTERYAELPDEGTRSRSGTELGSGGRARVYPKLGKDALSMMPCSVRADPKLLGYRRVRLTVDQKTGHLRLPRGESI